MYEWGARYGNEWKIRKNFKKYLVGLVNCEAYVRVWLCWFCEQKTP
ncbi:hypothetical protein VCR26J2_30015 [Vibrio coralliirubri]|nr:hypothetical protein VCR26J2_30015 [Vibrio coralliirubri]